MHVSLWLSDSDPEHCSGSLSDNQRLTRMGHVVVVNVQVVEYDVRLRTSLAEHRAGPQIPGGGAVEGVGFGFGMAVLSDDHHIDTQVMANGGDFWWGGAYSTYFYVDPTVRLSSSERRKTHSQLASN